MGSIEKIESFTVHCSSVLSQEDVNVLTLLYNPLIKDKAYNLYMLLSSLIDRTTLKSFTSKHQFILDMTLLTKEEFYEARIKLEAIGLLTTLYNDHSYIYMLKNPLTAQQFLVDGALGAFLYSEIGQTSFKQLFKLFSIPKISKDNYTNITKSFDDVFTTDIETIKIEKDEYILGRNINPGIKIEKFNFEYKKFLNSVKTIMDKPKQTSKKLETHITNMAYAYGFDENIMSNVYRQSVDASGALDYVRLNQNALDEFHFQYNKGLPKLVNKKEDELHKILTDLTAQDILKQYSQFKKALPDDVAKFAMIYQEFDTIDRAVLNLSIITVLKRKEGNVPVFDYFKKVINTLIKNGLTEFDDAKKYYYGEIKSNTTVADAPKKQVSKNPKNPKWLNEALDNIMEGVETL
ncbi:MAG: hypothetical protein R3Y05_00045 [bacterium]